MLVRCIALYNELHDTHTLKHKHTNADTRYIKKNYNLINYKDKTNIFNIKINNMYTLI